MTTKEKRAGLVAMCATANAEFCRKCPIYKTSDCRFEDFDDEHINRVYNKVFPNDSTDTQTPRECKSCESYEVLVHALREENEKLRGEILDLSETIVRMCKIIYGR